MEYPSLATGVLIGWEWLQRKAHIFIRFTAEHYRPDSELSPNFGDGRAGQAAAVMG
jgi:hypothetical protein